MKVADKMFKGRAKHTKYKGAKKRKNSNHNVIYICQVRGTYAQAAVHIHDVLYSYSYTLVGCYIFKCI